MKLPDIERGLRDHRKTLEAELKRVDRALAALWPEPAAEPAKPEAKKPAKKAAAKKPASKTGRKTASQPRQRSHPRRIETPATAGNGHSKDADYTEVLSGPTPEEHRPSPRGVFDRTEDAPEATEAKQPAAPGTLEDRVSQVREALQRHSGPVRASLVAAATGVSRDQALDVLKALEEQGEVRRSGNRRSTRWQLVSRRLEAVSS